MATKLVTTDIDGSSAVDDLIEMGSWAAQCGLSRLCVLSLLSPFLLFPSVRTLRILFQLCYEHLHGECRA